MRDRDTPVREGDAVPRDGDIPDEGQGHADENKDRDITDKGWG